MKNTVNYTHVTTAVLTSTQKAEALKKSAKLAKVEQTAKRAAATEARKAAQAAAEQSKLPTFKPAEIKAVTTAEIKAVEAALNRRNATTFSVDKYILRNKEYINQISHRSQASDHYGENFSKMFEIANSLIPMNAKAYQQEMFLLDWEKYIYDHRIAGHSGSMNRKTEGFYFKKSVSAAERAEFEDWALCGLRFENIKKGLNKLFTYIGLCFSAAKPMVEKYGYTLDITKACVLPDPIIEIKGKCDVIDNDRNVTLDVDYVQHRVMTDGRITTRCKSIPTCSIRFLSILKGCVVYDATEFHGTAVDIWGNEVNLEEKDLIIYASAFKLGQPPKDAASRQYDGSWFRSFDDFVAKATERGAQFYVCRDFSGEPKRAWACYQDLQTAFVGHADDRLLKAIVDHTEKWFNSMRTLDRAWTLLERSVGNCVRSNHAMYNIAQVVLWLQNGWTSMRNKALGGGIPDAGWYLPISVDTRGVLHGNEIYCDLLADGQHVSLARKPLIGPDGQFVAVNVSNYPDGPKHTVIVAADSMFWQAANADMDGDAVLVIDLLPLVRAVAVSQKRTGCKPVVFPEGDTKANTTNDERTVFEYALNRTTTTSIQIGGAVNDESIDLANSTYDREKSAKNTYDANDGVNVGKHESTANGAKEKTEKRKLPGFRMFTRNRAKAEDCEWTNGIVDSYCKMVNAAVSAKFELTEEVDEHFSPANLFNGGREEAIALYGNIATQEWLPRFYASHDAENQGLFQTLSFAASADFKKMRANEETLGVWVNDNINAARIQMFNLAQKITEENPCFPVRFVDVFMAITIRLFYGGMKDIARDRHTEESDLQIERKNQKIALWNIAFGTNLAANGMKVNGLKEQMLRSWFMFFEPEIVAANKAAQRKKDEEILSAFDLDEALAEINNDAEIFCLGEPDKDPDVAYAISDDLE